MIRYKDIERRDRYVKVLKGEKQGWWNMRDRERET